MSCPESENKIVTRYISQGHFLSKIPSCRLMKFMIISLLPSDVLYTPSLLSSDSNYLLHRRNRFLIYRATGQLIENLPALPVDLFSGHLRLVNFRTFEKLKKAFLYTKRTAISTILSVTVHFLSKPFLRRFLSKKLGKIGPFILQFLQYRNF